MPTPIDELLNDLVSEDDVSIWDVFTDVFIASMGEAGFAMVIAGVTTASLFSWTQNLTITTTWLLLVGGFFMVLLPGPAAAVLAVAATAMLAIAFYSVIWRSVGDQ